MFLKVLFVTYSLFSLKSNKLRARCPYKITYLKQLYTLDSALNIYFYFSLKNLFSVNCVISNSK